VDWSSVVTALGGSGAIFAVLAAVLQRLIARNNRKTALQEAEILALLPADSDARAHLLEVLATRTERWKNMGTGRVILIGLFTGLVALGLIWGGVLWGVQQMSGGEFPGVSFPPWREMLTVLPLVSILIGAYMIVLPLAWHLVVLPKLELPRVAERVLAHQRRLHQREHEAAEAALQEANERRPHRAQAGITQKGGPATGKGDGAS
jgi:hypothetical protein